MKTSEAAKKLNDIDYINHLENVLEEITNASKKLLVLAEKQLDQSATHDGITNAETIAELRKAITNATE